MQVSMPSVLNLVPLLSSFKLVYVHVVYTMYLHCTTYVSGVIVCECILFIGITCIYDIGAVIRRNNGGDVRFQGTSGSTERDSYQGYAITSGRFLATNREGEGMVHAPARGDTYTYAFCEVLLNVIAIFLSDFAVSLPKRNLYFGTVSLPLSLTFPTPLPSLHSLHKPYPILIH